MRLAFYHRITLSARASTFGGIVRPICFAALRLTINSNFIGCSTGRSAGLAPFKILSTYVAARRAKSAWLGAVSHEPTGFNNFTLKIDCRQPVLYREIYHLCSTNIDHKASQLKDRFSTLLGCGAERSFNILGI